jgi:formate hydrogenlyase transcriptional activator
LIENASENADLTRKQYLTLLEISKAIASHRDLTGLFHDLADRLHQLFDFHNLRVLVHDGAHNVMRMQILETDDPAMRKFPTELPVEGSISGWVWQNQQPFITGEVQQETRFTTAKQLCDYPVKSLCVLPLTTVRERLGVLIFASENAAAFDRIDLEFAQLVAAQIAVAVEAQCYQAKLARERDRSEMLLEINNTLVSNLDQRELLSAISDCIQRVVSHDLAALALYDPKINMLRMSALDFPSNEDLFREGETLPIDGAQCGLAFRERRAVILNGDDEPEAPSCKRFVAAGVRSCCIVPLVSHDRTLGTLSVGSLRENAFGQEDAELLGQIANQVAIAVENVIAFRKIEALKNKLEEEKLYLEEEIRDERYFEDIIGNSSALRRVLQEVETVAPADSTVLIIGETGTGKELIARAIHNLSARRDRTLVKVNCAAIPTGLLESELFGHEKGAFTGANERRAGRFELAHHGTIFLDEVGDIPPELQPKLLRVLQEQEFERLGSSKTIRVDARVVAATNVNLARLVDEKKFRSDLYYRLNVFPIHLPPLRERPEDIPMLVHFFANKYAQRMKKPIERIPAETMAVLTAYRWPGNIRELQNLIERAVILTRGRVLEVPLAELKQSAKVASNHSDRADGGVTLENVEREHILKILRESNWVIGGPKGAAARLGLHRTTLNTRIRKLGITRPRPEQF